MPDPVETPQTEPASDEAGLLAAVRQGVADAAGAPAAAAPAPESEPAEAADPAAPADPVAEPAAAPDPAAEPVAEPAAAEPVEEPPAEPAEKRPSDEFGTLDERTSEKTRERFETLKSRYDEEVGARSAAEAKAQQWVDTVASTRASPQQFSDSLTYLHLVNSGDRASLEQAFAIMNREREVLAKALGYPVEGYDPLEQFPDLKQKVEDEAIDRETALELARHRAGTRVDTVAAETRQMGAAAMRERQDAVKGLHELGARLRGSDPQFAAKQGVILPFIKRIEASNIPPSQWVSLVEEAYRDLKLPGAAAAPQPNAGPPNPLRPNGAGPAGGSAHNREPQSPLEAMQMGNYRGA